MEEVNVVENNTVGTTEYPASPIEKSAHFYYPKIERRFPDDSMDMYRKMAQSLGKNR